MTQLLLKNALLAKGLLVDDYLSKYGRDEQYYFAMALISMYDKKNHKAIEYFKKIVTDDPINNKQIKTNALLNIAILQENPDLFDEIYDTYLSDSTETEIQLLVNRSKASVDPSRIGGLTINRRISRQIVKSSMKFPLWYRDQRYFVYVSIDNNLYVIDSTLKIIAAWSSSHRMEDIGLADILTEFGKPERVMWSRNRKYQVFETHKFVLSSTGQNFQWFIY